MKFLWLLWYPIVFYLKNAMRRPGNTTTIYDVLFLQDFYKLLRWNLGLKKMQLFKKFIHLISGNWTIVNCFTFFYTLQFLSKFEGNFIFKCGRFWVIKLEENVVNGLMWRVLVQLTSCKITNITTETMSWIRLFERTEKKFWFIDFIIRNISCPTSAPVTPGAVTPAPVTTSSTAAPVTSSSTVGFVRAGPSTASSSRSKSKTKS